MCALLISTSLYACCSKFDLFLSFFAEQRSAGGEHDGYAVNDGARVPEDGRESVRILDVPSFAHLCAYGRVVHLQRVRAALSQRGDAHVLLARDGRFDYPLRL